MKTPNGRGPLALARRVVFTTLKIYDVFGNEITTLVNEEKQPGTYKVEFSAKGRYASGVYFYQLKARILSN